MNLAAPLYETLESAGLSSVLGSPLRVYSAGDAGDGPVAKPYVLWQTVGGEPGNYLGDAPAVDRFTLQVDVVASSAAQARTTASAVIQALEGKAYVTGYNSDARNPTTRDYEFSFDVEWLVLR